MDTPYKSKLQMMERNTPCMSTVLAMEKECTLGCTLLVVESKTPLRPYGIMYTLMSTMSVVKRDAQLHTHGHTVDFGKVYNSMSTLLAVKMGYTLMSILLTVERDTTASPYCWR